MLKKILLQGFNEKRTDAREHHMRVLVDRWMGFRNFHKRSLLLVQVKICAEYFQGPQGCKRGIDECPRYLIVPGKKVLTVCLGKVSKGNFLFAGLPKKLEQGLRGGEWGCIRVWVASSSTEIPYRQFWRWSFCTGKLSKVGNQRSLTQGMGTHAKERRNGEEAPCSHRSSLSRNAVSQA